MLDIGVNLTNGQFSGDVPQVVARARQAGLNGMIITGTSLTESAQALRLAQAYPDFCWATAGVHPHDAHCWSENSAADLEPLLSSSAVVAVGECGLDFARNFSTPAQQEVAFEAQLALAARIGKPVFLHCREAHARFIALLRPWLSRLPGAVLHCFTGTRDELDACLSLGLYIGITGWICDERRGMPLRALLPHIPTDRLLLETDAPYLLPRDIQPKPKSRRNEPCFLPHIAEQAARWRQQDARWLKQVTENNARQLFRLA
ncbi:MULTISPECIES: 3'-5' ssDNA/RNA exonuclease TatD [Edwardsiella]|uniref:3'-5' ssDNA/RNA exonuclease TatD n=2 Tax=Edwardsiella anguillarum TaxID=1821960 RepID=A0A076LIG7_9GAMM|nr:MULTISPECIES: 3'-5' ssDNA/RNA exonuclease TatD [Edwardsiella]AKM46279.1 DNase TatD [Edwardsiella sp. EA181011]GAJ67919.1 deoxyribonuclease TatD [Edwardsiella piscicida]AIJ08360.1 Deoxyribonuclease TatD [Edwardsiella anguillarum ET080813]AKR76457.1 3'-5' ssDNA/RNA exonuclease TatD [Edwardsiella sp. LADL05-105]KAB0591581.1 3'-5' ssDNA/RNA exonuclease TatD [Edwardsiella anguillarum]